MTGKEKLHLALNHRDGPVPVDFGATAITGIHCTIVEKLREYYGLEKRPVTIQDPYQMLGVVDEDLRQALGVDVIGYPALYDLMGLRHNGDVQEWKTPWGQDVLMPGDFRYEVKDGKVYSFPPQGENPPASAVLPDSGCFFDAIVRQEEFDEEDLNPEDNLEEFGPLSEENIAFLKKGAEALAKTSYGVVGGPGGTGLGDIAMVPAVQLAAPKGIRDVEEWYVSTAIRRDYLHEVFSRQTEISIQNLQTYKDIVGDLADVVNVCGTDFGTQHSTFCSLDTFRELYFPYYKKINDWIHENTGWKTFKHSCGAVEPFIDSLLDCGFDILNPVQWTAAGMDKENLKQKYGSRLVFWGGGVDTQRVLPYGTAEEVYAQVTDCLKCFAPGGGYVFNTIHNTQAKTPVENFAAMVRALRDFNR